MIGAIEQRGGPSGAAPFCVRLTPHPILRGLENLAFDFGNDIDHTTPLGRGEQVLAWANFGSAECRVGARAESG